REASVSVQNHSAASMLVPGVRQPAAAKSTAAGERLAVETAAAQHSGGLQVFFGMNRINKIRPGIGAIPVLAPMPEVAVHIVKAPRIGRESDYPGGLVSEDPYLAVWAIGGPGVVVSLFSSDRVAPPEWGGGPRPAGVFPLGLRRQAVGQLFPFTQPGTE